MLPLSSSVGSSWRAMHKNGYCLTVVNYRKVHCWFNNEEGREIGATDLPNWVTREFSGKTACASAFGIAQLFTMTF